MHVKKKQINLWINLSIYSKKNNISQKKKWIKIEYSEVLIKVQDIELQMMNNLTVVGLQKPEKIALVNNTQVTNRQLVKLSYQMNSDH